MLRAKFRTTVMVRRLAMVRVKIRTWFIDKARIGDTIRDRIKFRDKVIVRVMTRQMVLGLVLYVVKGCVRVIAM